MCLINVIYILPSQIEKTKWLEIIIPILEAINSEHSLKSCSTTFFLNGLRAERHVIRCIPTSISVTRRPLAFFVNFNITSGKKH